MSSEDDTSKEGTATGAKYFKLSRVDQFENWKEKTLALARNKGLYEYMTVPGKTKFSEEDIIEKEDEMFAEQNDVLKRKLKREHKAMKLNNKRIDAACCMLTMSVKGKVLKKIKKVEGDPQKMFACIEAKYGNEEGDGALEDLMMKFGKCRLKTIQQDPDDWTILSEELDE